MPPPEGQFLKRKVLSSAVVKGKASAGSTAVRIIDPSRNEPSGFWRGYNLRRLDASGRVVAEHVVVDSQIDGSLSLAPLPGTDAVLAQALAGSGYELVSPEEAPILAIRLFLGLRLDQPIPPCSVRLGTTRGTNALLTRRGAKTAFVTTRGFADILRIGYQNRPKLFELAIKKPEPLFAAVAEIDERIAADGSILLSPARSRSAISLSRLKRRDRIARDLPVEQLCESAHEAAGRANRSRAAVLHEISVCSRVSPLMKIVPRGDTTVVDAYLNPVLRTYVERLAQSLPGSDVRLMTSAGGLAVAANLHRQRLHPFRAGRRRGRFFAGGRGSRLSAGDRLRHGRHQHRRVALRRPLRI